MSGYLKNLLVVTIASAPLVACGKSAAPELSAQEAYKHCTSNQVIGMKLGSGGSGGEKDMAEAMSKIINECMEKRHFKCTKTSPSEPCDWTPIR